MCRPPPVAHGPRWLLPAVLLAVFAAGSPVLGFDFIWDDLHTIVHGRLIKDPANLAALFTHDSLANSDFLSGGDAGGGEYRTWRPLALVSFLFDWWWSGGWAGGFHLTSLVLHLACVALVFTLAVRVTGRRVAAAVAATAFGLHPALHEGWVWINGRSDPLATLLFLSLVHLQLTGLERGRTAARAGGALVLGILAMTAKEASLLAAPLLLLVPAPRDDTWWPTSLSVRLAVAAPAFVGFAVGFGLRAWALAGPGVAPPSGGWAVLAALPWVFIEAARRLVLPTETLPPSLFERFGDLSAAESALGWALALALGGAALWLSRRTRMVFPALVGSATLLAPVALFVTAPYLGFGRYLYLPAALLAIAGAELGAAVARRRAIPTAAPIAVLLALAGLHLLIVGAWRDPLTFAHGMVADYPGSAHAHAHLGATLVAVEAWEEAAATLSEATRLEPRDPWPRAGLALSLHHLGRSADSDGLAAPGCAATPPDAMMCLVAALNADKRRDGAAVAALAARGLEASPRYAALRAFIQRAAGEYPEVAARFGCETSPPQVGAARSCRALDAEAPGP